jgi:malate dehydrogenase
MDLLEVNAKIVEGVTEEILKYSDNPSIVVVTNPLDQMTTLASDVSGLPKNKVMGQAGILDSSRFAYFIAEKLSVDTSDVYALTLGSHGETMVPVPSLCTVKGEPLIDILSESDINELVEKTSNGGAEIVGLLKTGSAYFAPASSAAVMVKSIINNSDEIFPVCAWLEGQYGIDNVYLGVPAKLGKDGVTEVVEFELTEHEKNALIDASNAVKAKVEELNNIKNQ